jgi:type IV pilus assembly protein PilV
MRQFRQIAGFAMVEAMVTVVVVAFGLLGIAGLVSRSFVTEVEGTQRTEAILLLQDMASRIEANRNDIASYVTGGTGITGPSTACSTNLAAQDLCEWGQLLAGANEQVDARNAGVLVGAIGCIYEIDSFRRVYAIAIAWQGMSAGPAPLVDPNVSLDLQPTACGQNRYGATNENRRRVLTLPVQLGTLGS